MTPWASRVSAGVCWLRRPYEVIEACRIFKDEQHIESLADLERVIAEHGAEIHPWEIDPTTDGATVTGQGDTRYVLLKPGLQHLRRELTLVHELGHLRLHLNGVRPAGVLLETGGIKDVEADVFLIMCLGFTVGEQNWGRVVHYMRANPNMIRRPFLVILYLTGYTPRLFLANVLEKLFLSPRTQGDT